MEVHLLEASRTKTPVPVEYLDLMSRLCDAADPTRDDVSDPAVRAWRDRQKARTASQLSPENNRGVAHITVAFELSSGCSMGCWFCAVSAVPLSGVFEYSASNTDLWRDVLFAVRGVLGASAGSGLCYWASDPFDNPHYELFCADFAAVLGQWPQTTTALAHANPSRTRALLDASWSHGQPMNRFSVLSRSQLRKVHEEFSAEELALVPLVAHLPGGVQLRDAGRARHRESHRGRGVPQPGTTACLSGFLINMVQRRVRLLTPWPANDVWPDGSAVLAEAEFTDADDLRACLTAMVGDHMPTRPPDDRPLGLRPDLRFVPDQRGFVLESAHAQHRVHGDAYLPVLGRLLAQGDRTLGNLADELSWYGVPRRRVERDLCRLWERGLLDELAVTSSEPA